MVVHNSKWDRKAKQQYLRKHGLKASDVDRKKRGTQGPGAEGSEWRPQDDGESSDESNESNDEKNQGEGSGSINGAIVDGDKQGASNVWRYQTMSAEEEVNDLLRQADQSAAADGVTTSLAQAAVTSLDEHVPRDADFFPSDESDGANGEYDEIIRRAAQQPAKALPVAKHKKNKHRDALDDSSDENEDSKPEVQVHDDPAEYRRLQRIIDRSKVADDIKRRFGRKAAQTRSGGPTATDDADFDDFLKDIDGLAVTGAKESLSTTPAAPASSVVQAKQDYLDFLLN